MSLSGDRFPKWLVSPRRNDNLDDGSWIGIRQPQFPAEFIDTLPHSADADAHTFGPQLNHLLRDAFSIIADRDHNVSVSVENAHHAVARSRVTKHVCQGFLNNPKDSGFQFGLQPPHVRGIYLQPHFDTAALRQPLQEPA